MMEVKVIYLKEGEPAGTEVYQVQNSDSLQGIKDQIAQQRKEKGLMMYPLNVRYKMPDGWSEK